jgi:hypothetical protein
MVDGILVPLFRGTPTSHQVRTGTLSKAIFKFIFKRLRKVENSLDTQNEVGLRVNF